MKLTKREIDRLQPRAKSYRVADDEVRGLFLTVNPSGSKSWAIRYGRRGAQRLMTLARGQVLTLDQARAEARKKLAEAALGGDPAEDRKRSAGVPTFGSWVSTYIERIRPVRKSWKETSRYLAIAAEAWGRRRLDSIGAEDVQRLLAEVPEERAATHNRLLAAVSSCLTAARKSGYIPANPAMGLPVRQEAPPRDRTLTDTERSSLLAAFEAEADQHARAALLMLAATGARLSEVLRARWEDVDLDAAVPSWRIPAPKSGRPESIPLPKGVVEMLRALPKTSTYIVAGTEGTTGDEARKMDARRFDLKGPWRRALTRAGLENAKLRTHDLRRDLGKRIYRAAGLIAASRIRRHRDVRITSEVYSGETAADLAGALQEQEANVVPFRPARQA